jgi:KDO2-lipid IV(A) lauroyltransferase
MFTPEQVAHLKQYIANLRPGLGGKFLYYCIPFRKQVVLANMRQVFAGVLTPAEITRLAQGFYQHIYLSLRENILMRFQSDETIKAKSVVIGEEYIRELEGNDVKGAIFITGHFGNWEFAPIAGIMQHPELRNRFFFVRRTLVNKTIERILFRRYYAAGLGVIPKKNSLEKVCHILETNNAVVFVMDQHASHKAKDGVFVDFFGRPAGTFKSPALIARYTGVPVLPSRGYRRADGKHVLEFCKRLPWISCDDPDEEIKTNTRQYNAVLEKFILEYPDQWLWMHRRWKGSEDRGQKTEDRKHTYSRG